MTTSHAGGPRCTLSRTWPHRGGLLDQFAGGRTGQPWTQFEIEATVGAYLDITRWEVEGSGRRPEAYSLYRVHGFTRDPRIHVLDGSVEDNARLDPSVFLGIPIEATSLARAPRQPAHARSGFMRALRRG